MGDRLMESYGDTVHVVEDNYNGSTKTIQVYPCNADKELANVRESVERLNESLEEYVKTQQEHNKLLLQILNVLKTR